MMSSGTGSYEMHSKPTALQADSTASTPGSLSCCSWSAGVAISHFWRQKRHQLVHISPSPPPITWWWDRATRGTVLYLLYVASGGERGDESCIFTVHKTPDMLPLHAHAKSYRMLVCLGSLYLAADESGRENGRGGRRESGRES